MANTQYRFATGHIAKATIQGSSSYLLSNFATQSDQYANLKWNVASYVQIKDYGVRSMSMGGKYTAMGSVNFVIALSGVTPGMLDYWYDQFLPAVESKEITLQVPDKRQPSASQLVVYQAIIHRPEPGEIVFRSGRPTPIAFNVPFRITRGVLLA